MEIALSRCITRIRIVSSTHAIKCSLMLIGDMVYEVKTDSLKEGDLILIKPRENVAADGIISEGNSYLNEIHDHRLINSQKYPSKYS